MTDDVELEPLTITITADTGTFLELVEAACRQIAAFYDTDTRGRFVLRSARQAAMHTAYRAKTRRRRSR